MRQFKKKALTPHEHRGVGVPFFEMSHAIFPHV